MKKKKAKTKISKYKQFQEAIMDFLIKKTK